MSEAMHKRRATVSRGLIAGILAAGLAVPALAAGFDIIVDTGDATPDGTGTFDDSFSSYNTPVLNNLGGVVFSTRRLSTSSDSGIFVGSVGTALLEMARSGQAAPDNDGVLSTELHNADALSVNDLGQVVFQTTYVNSTPERIRGILLSTGGTLTSIVRENDPVPNTTGVFYRFEGGVLNNNGQVAFGAGLDGTPGGTAGGTADSWGVFRGTGGTPVEIVREGQALPGGGNADGSNSTPNLNGSGTVVLTANADAVYTGNGGPLTTVAHVGDPAPDQNGNPLGTFTAFHFRESTAPPVISANGQVLFEARLAGLTNATNFGLYLAENTGTRQIVREGLATPSGNGTFSDNFPTFTLNDFGQVAFLNNVDNSNAGDADNQGLFFDGGAGLIEVVREGQAAPGGGTFVEVLDYALNGSGVAGQQANFAFSADLDTNNDDAADTTGLFFVDDNQVTELLRLGDTLAGGTVTDLAFRGSTGGFGLTSSGLNDLGQIAFLYELNGTSAGVALWTPDITGDYNDSGQVEQGDLDLVLSNWGVDTSGGAVPAGWVNDLPEGLVEQTELDKVLANWGFTFPDGTTDAAPVPEPAAALALLGLLGVSGRTRRRMARR